MGKEKRKTEKKLFDFLFVFGFFLLLVENYLSTKLCNCMLILVRKNMQTLYQYMIAPSQTLIMKFFFSTTYSSSRVSK